MQGPNAGGGWRRELGSFLQLGVFLLAVAVVLLVPGEKSPGFLLFAIALVIVFAGCLAWAVYRRRSGPGGPPE